jgi:hypothetical protein
MKNYNFFKKFSLSSNLNHIFLNSLYVCFFNIFFLKSKYWFQIRKVISLFGIKLLFCNKTLLKKKCSLLKYPLSLFNLCGGNLIILYSFNSNCEKLLTNNLLIKGLLKSFLCSYFCKRFMFFNSFKYFAEKNSSDFFSELIFTLVSFFNNKLNFSCFYSKKLVSILNILH